MKWYVTYADTDGFYDDDYYYRCCSSSADAVKALMLILYQKMR